MDNELFEVTRDQYVGFLNQIKKEAKKSEVEEDDDGITVKTYSVTYGTHFATRYTPKAEDKNEQYYVFNMPSDDERCAPKPIKKIVLETKEEVQEFFDALSKISRGELHD